MTYNFVFKSMLAYRLMIHAKLDSATLLAIALHLCIDHENLIYCI